MSIGAAVIVLAACSTGDEPAPGEPEGTEGTAQDSRDVSVQLYQAPTSFNPLIASIGPNHLISQLHWDGLVSVGPDNEYESRLAESWSVSEDGMTWTFDLRDDVTWSDGEPFTADDVLFSFELYADPASGSANAGKFASVDGAAAFADGEADSIAGFTAPDDHTFVVSLTEPNSAFLIDLIQPILFILPEHVVGEFPVEELTDHQFFREPTVGLGPYVFQRWVTDDQIEFHPNPQYRNELHLDRVFAQFLTTDVAMAQLETGEIDYAQVAAADATRVEQIDGVTLHRDEGPGVMALHTAHDSGKLADVRVRQAILHAIDRDSLVDEVLNGEGKVVDTLIHGPDWAMPDDLTHYDYDPARAQALLDEAGWDSETPVRLEVTPGQADRDTIVTIVAGQLQAVGIDATVAEMESSVMAERIGERDFDLLISGYGMFNIDPAAMDARVKCNQIGGSNLSGYCNEELDELLEQGIATADQDERQQIYAEAQRIMNEEVPIILLYSPNNLAGTSAQLQGFETAGSVSNHFWNAADWSVGG
nr:ABC transporter substrate-binding protein [Phytoactinopolyspora alkaliphila]